MLFFHKTCLCLADISSSHLPFYLMRVLIEICNDDLQTAKSTYFPLMTNKREVSFNYYHSIRCSFCKVFCYFLSGNIDSVYF